MEKLGGKLESETERIQRERALLEERLQSLIDRKVEGFELDEVGSTVSIRFDNGEVLEFSSWDALHDLPYPEGVRVYTPEKGTEKADTESGSLE